MQQSILKHYVYETTNLVNGKIYVGVHKSSDIENDSYLGSGVAINRAIDKYSIENFERKILFEFETSEEAYDKEKEIVTEEFVKREDTYNLSLGGMGGWYFHLTETTVEKKARYDKASKTRTGIPLSKERREKISNSLKGKKFTEERKSNISKGVKGFKHTKEAKEKIKLASTGRKHSQESKNKMSLATTKIKSIKVEKDDKIFSSIKDCAKYFSLTEAKVQKWSKEGINGFKRI